MKAHIGPKKVPHAGRLEVSIVESTQDFCGLEEEWDELYQASPKATPFQSWAWLYSWWEHYGEGYELRLVTVRDGGLLVGLIPLMIERRAAGLYKRLLFLAPKEPYRDMLTREGYEERVSEMTAEAVRGMGSWQVADLANLSPDAVIWKLFQRWKGPWSRDSMGWASEYLHVDVKPWEEILTALSKNNRKLARRSLRRVETEGVLRRLLIEPEDVEEAGRRLVALHREMWREKAIDPEHLTERYESYLACAARRLAARGLGGISEFRCDGEVLVSTFLVFGNSSLGTYRVGASQEAMQRYSVSSLYIWDAIEIALARNKAHFSFMYGQEPYKLRWKPRVILNYRVVLGRRPLLWRLCVGYHALRWRATRFIVQSGIIPQWAKDAAKSYRTARSWHTRIYGGKEANRLVTLFRRGMVQIRRFGE